MLSYTINGAGDGKSLPFPTALPARVLPASTVSTNTGVLPNPALEPTAPSVVVADPFYRRPWFIPAAIGGVIVLALLLVPGKAADAVADAAEG